MYVIRGIKKHSGEYKGVKYENFTLFCTKPDDTVIGEVVATIKVKSAVLQKAFPDSTSIVGSSVDFVMEQRFYDGKPSIVVTDIKNLGKEKS